MSCTKYKVGDRLRIVNLDKSGGSPTKIGETVRVIAVGDYSYRCAFDKPGSMAYALRDSELEYLYSDLSPIEARINEYCRGYWSK